MYPFPVYRPTKCTDIVLDPEIAKMERFPDQEITELERCQDA